LSSNYLPCESLPNLIFPFSLSFLAYLMPNLKSFEMDALLVPKIFSERRFLCHQSIWLRASSFLQSFLTHPRPHTYHLLWNPRGFIAVPSIIAQHTPPCWGCNVGDVNFLLPSSPSVPRTNMTPCDVNATWKVLEAPSIPGTPPSPSPDHQQDIQFHRIP
jgi:hypothetical protein